ncbi:hypothetical protein ZIOFF_073000 [Zingiber officinale]|uniref:SNARE-complex protein Syntaxin-18 N-terminal domain-containing protein n=1 Tax=Zingiber officinale TaxID=94328 RepID=A0A8J5BBD6_ZINOF|nr:hypothetical protein ZIOFF_073000 [Zingiber officinale]
MAKGRDRTEDFREATHATALSFGYDEVGYWIETILIKNSKFVLFQSLTAKLVALLASFILRKPLEKPPFEKAAIKTLESISELEHFITKHRKDYVDLHRITEQERDNIEHEVSYPKLLQQNIIERILEDVQNEQHQQHRVQQVLPKKAQQSKSSARKPRTVPNYAHISAIKIQAAYRGYRPQLMHDLISEEVQWEVSIRNQNPVPDSETWLSIREEAKYGGLGACDELTLGIYDSIGNFEGTAIYGIMKLTFENQLSDLFVWPTTELNLWEVI